MAYPPRPHQEHDPAKIEGLIRAFPFAHFFTSETGAQQVTRIPFALDVDAGGVCRLRAHMNAHNPQCRSLNGAEALIAFSGPDSYVSPNWRTASDRGATWDYTAVHVWGRVRVRDDREFFERLIDDLAAVAEARFQGVSDKPDWSMKNVTDEYVERLRPKLCAFEIEILRIEAISKLHQNFPEADARCVAEHLARSAHENSRTIGALIAQRLEQ
ncbi:MAG: FMN-binding negative transcriptional regulator [Pseudomonadota bacterium]